MYFAGYRYGTGSATRHTTDRAAGLGAGNHRDRHRQRVVWRVPPTPDGAPRRRALTAGKHCPHDNSIIADSENTRKLMFAELVKETSR
jgi:hypothetical protein